MIFSDGGEWDGSEEYYKTKEFLAWLYNDFPVKDEVVVNDRFAKDMAGYYGDYYSSEYSDATFKNHHPWEESRGIGGSYGYNRAENLENYSTSKHLILELVDIVSRGGNLLLNVGPAADGTIPVIMQERLVDIGKWLAVNGEAIYGTRKRNISSEETGGQKVFYTGKDKNIYAIFSTWPQQALQLTLEKGSTVSAVSMLGLNKKIDWKQDGEKLSIVLPSCTVNELPSVDAWSIKIVTE